MNAAKSATFFAPQLLLRDVRAGVEFYKVALGAVELRRWENPDATLHVAEMEIGGRFHLHEEMAAKGEFSPGTVKGTTCDIGLFVDDPSALMLRVLAAGGRLRSPVQDYDYGYRQGTFLDPEGHSWTLQKKI